MRKREKLPGAVMLTTSGTSYLWGSSELRCINKPHCLNYIDSDVLCFVVKSLLIETFSPKWAYL